MKTGMKAIALLAILIQLGWTAMSRPVFSTERVGMHSGMLIAERMERSEHFAQVQHAVRNGAYYEHEDRNEFFDIAYKAQRRPGLFALDHEWPGVDRLECPNPNTIIVHFEAEGERQLFEYELRLAMQRDVGLVSAGMEWDCKQAADEHFAQPRLVQVMEIQASSEDSVTTLRLQVEERSLEHVFEDLEVDMLHGKVASTHIAGDDHGFQSSFEREIPLDFFEDSPGHYMSREPPTGLRRFSFRKRFRRFVRRAVNTVKAANSVIRSIANTVVAVAKALVTGNLELKRNIQQQVSYNYGKSDFTEVDMLLDKVSNDVGTASLFCHQCGAYARGALNFQIKIKKFRLYTVRTVLSGDALVSAAMRLTVDGAYSKEYQSNLFSRVSRPTVVMLGPVPVTFTPKVDVALIGSFEAEGNAEFIAGAYAKGGVRFGFQKVSPRSRMEMVRGSTFSYGAIGPTYSAQLSVVSRLGLRPVFSVLVSYIGSGYINAEMFGYAGATLAVNYENNDCPSQDSSFSINLGVDGAVSVGAGIDITVPTTGKSLFKYDFGSFNIASFHKSLYTTCLPLNVGRDAKDARDPLFKLLTTGSRAETVVDGNITITQLSPSKTDGITYVGSINVNENRSSTCMPAFDTMQLSEMSATVFQYDASGNPIVVLLQVDAEFRFDNYTEKCQLMRSYAVNTTNARPGVLERARMLGVDGSTVLEVSSSRILDEEQQEFVGNSTYSFCKIHAWNTTAFNFLEVDNAISEFVFSSDINSFYINFNNSCADVVLNGPDDTCVNAANFPDGIPDGMFECPGQKSSSSPASALSAMLSIIF